MLGNNPGGITKAWIPFTVYLPNGLSINSATLYMTAAYNDSSGVNVKYGCENTVNPSTPSDGPDLQGRSLTAAYASGGVASWTQGSLYSFNVTAGVQEVLNYGGWASGDLLAVLFENNGTSIGDRRRPASADNGTYAHPYLVIDFNEFIPQASVI